MRRALATMGPAMAAELPPEKEREVRVANAKIVTRNSQILCSKLLSYIFGFYLDTPIWIAYYSNKLSKSQLI
jgi:hypothetical protein